VTEALRASVQAFKEPGVMAAAGKLLRMRAQVSWNDFKRAKIGRKIGTGFLALGALALLVFMFFFSKLILDAMQSPQFASAMGVNGEPFLRAIPTLVITAGTLAILMTSFGTMLQALYLSTDMDFLMSAPIPMRSIFISKLVQGILPNFLIYCLLGVPLLYGLGISSGYNFIYFPLVIIVLAMLSLAGAGLAALLVMVLARFFPARRIAEITGFVVGITFMVLGQSSNMMRFTEFNPQQTSALLTSLEKLHSPLSPLSWAADGLINLGAGKWLSGTGLLLLSVGSSLALFIAALVTAEKLYYSGWASLQTKHTRKKRGNGSGDSLRYERVGLLDRLIGQPVAAILRKDFRLYRRDLRNLSRMVTPLILGIIYAFMAIRGGEMYSQNNADVMEPWRTILDTSFLYSDVLLALFIGWILTSSIAGLAFSMEGAQYANLKGAPLNSWQLIRAKFLTSWLPAAVLCFVYILVLQLVRGFDPAAFLLAEVAVTAILSGLTGIYLSFGVAGAKFDWTNPNEMGKSVGCLGMIAGAAFVPLGMLLFVGPPVLFVLLRWPIWLGQLTGALLGLGGSAAAAILPLAAASRRVPLLNES